MPDNLKKYDIIIKTEIIKVKPGNKIMDANPRLISNHRITSDMLDNETNKGKIINSVIEQHAPDLKLSIRKSEIHNLIYEIY